MQEAVITASASILVAVLAFAFNQYSQARQERRQGHLDRVSTQLRELYGPLFALSDVNERIWESLRDNGLPHVAHRNADTLRQDWAVWRDEFLMPTNVRMRDLIVAHADLLAEGHFPDPLREFCAHVGSCEVVLATPAASATAGPGGGDPSAKMHINHPGSEFVDYVRGSFARLKAEQQRLLSPRRRRPCL